MLYHTLVLLFLCDERDYSEVNVLKRLILPGTVGEIHAFQSLLGFFFSAACELGQGGKTD